MAESEKTRIMSNYYRAYIDDHGREIAKGLNLQVDDTFSDEDKAFLQENHNREPYPNFWLTTDPLEISPYAEIFYKRLLEQSPLAFVWLKYYIVTSEGKKVASRKRRTNPIVIIWNILGLFLPQDVKEALEQAYFKISENRPFLITGVVTALYFSGYTIIFLMLYNRTFFKLYRNEFKIIS